MDERNDLMDDIFIQVRELENQKNKLLSKIKVIDDFLSSPEIKILSEKAEKLTEEKRQLDNTINESLVTIKTMTRLIETDENNLKIEEEELLEATKKFEEEEKIFTEEVKLNLVLKKDEIEEKNNEYIASLCISKGLSREANLSYQNVLESLTEKFATGTTRLANYRIRNDDYHYFENKERTRKIIKIFYDSAEYHLEEFMEKLNEDKKTFQDMIREEDRKIFFEILSGNLGVALSNMIKDSRQWIKNISKMMESIDTSMKLTFSLDWKPLKAQWEDGLSTEKLENILALGSSLATQSDLDEIVNHFRTKINELKNEALIKDEIINYREFIGEALDYRKWFEFKFSYKRGNQSKKELTNSAFNTFSGGEKAMSMYVPFFTAISTQYAKAEKKEAPRIIALDEAFAGVDDKNIETMFKMAQDMEFDYIFNSQSLWGTFEMVDALSIYELLRNEDSNIVFVQNYLWNGHEKMLNDSSL